MRCDCDLTECILDLATPVEVLIESTGEYRKGRWESQPKESKTMNLVVQPATPKDIRDLPEGRRTEESLAIYSLEKLETVSSEGQKQPMEIIWKDNTYEIHSVEDQETYGKYYRSIAVKKGQ